MKSLGKITETLENGLYKVHNMADKTLVRFTGAGSSCKVQAGWDEDEGHSFAKKQTLMENIVIVIDVPIKFIKISEKNGEGKVIIEGYN